MRSIGRLGSGLVQLVVGGDDADGKQPPGQKQGAEAVEPAEAEAELAAKMREEAVALQQGGLPACLRGAAAAAYCQQRRLSFLGAPLGCGRIARARPALPCQAAPAASFKMPAALQKLPLLLITSRAEVDVYGQQKSFAAGVSVEGKCHELGTNGTAKGYMAAWLGGRAAGCPCFCGRCGALCGLPSLGGVHTRRHFQRPDPEPLPRCPALAQPYSRVAAHAGAAATCLGLALRPLVREAAPELSALGVVLPPSLPVDLSACRGVAPQVRGTTTALAQRSALLLLLPLPRRCVLCSAV